MTPFWRLLALALLLAGCGERKAAQPHEARPALWLAEKDGRRAWLMGTVHMLPEGAVWSGGAVGKALGESQRLVLEAQGLDDDRAIRATFDRLGMAPGLPPVAQRVPAKDRAMLAELTRGGASLDGYEDWAAALLLTAAVDARMKAVPGKGVEPALIARFTARRQPIEGLETIAEQFAQFDALPAGAQRAMLVDTVRQADGADADFDAMYADWAKGDVAALGKALDDELDASPALRAAVLTDRNARWDARIDAIVARPGTEFVAAGAAHLIGAGSLLERMEKRGWRVRRVQ